MSTHVNTLLIEGSFDELCDELAVYLDNLATAQGQSSTIQNDIAPLIQAEKKDDVLRLLVKASAILNSAPEREILAAYNLVIHLIHQSSRPDSFLGQVCDNVSQPFTSSPNNGVGLALGVLTTIFNTLPPKETSRYLVLEAVLKIIQSYSTFETLRPQLDKLETWMATWAIPKPQQRKLYLAISDVAAIASASSGAPNAATEESSVQQTYLLKALRTLQDGDEASSPEAQSLSVRALKAALNSEKTYDFQDLTSLDSVQSLRRSEPTWYDLLEIFSFKTLDDFTDFVSSNDKFLSSNGLDYSKLERKMRLLTLATLCATAASSTRTVSYASIESALKLDSNTSPTSSATPSDPSSTPAVSATTKSSPVELWIIDVIRAGLVEGKMSQRESQLLVHRATYRVFDERQWRVVAGRLDQWKESLIQVLKVVRAEKESFIRDKEIEMREAEQAALNASSRSGGGDGGHGGGSGGRSFRNALGGGDRGAGAGASSRGFNRNATGTTMATNNATAVEVE